MPSEHELIQTTLLNDLLERLSNTPLMRVNSRGQTINQTVRVWFAIDFLQSFAKERGLTIEFGKQPRHEDA